MDIHIYEEEQRNLYTHHDIMLPSFPLAIEWINYHPKSASASSSSTTSSTDDEASSSSSSAFVKKGNNVAVGTFQQHIEVWDLDVIDTLEPLLVLGQPPMLPNTGKNKRTKKNKNKRPPMIVCGLITRWRVLFGLVTQTVH
jgi:periodic tryptophan protein 1